MHNASPLRATGAPAGFLRSVGLCLHTLALRLGPDCLMNLYCEAFTSMFQDLNLKMCIMAALDYLFITPVVLIHMITFLNEISDFINEITDLSFQPSRLSPFFCFNFYSLLVYA